MNDEVSMRECLSALADGELPGHECPQALAYARERHLYANGDFQRQANQQQVMTAGSTD